MAQIHNMRHQGRRTKSFFISAKSFAGNTLRIAGTLFNVVLIVSIAVQVLNGLLGLEFMQNPILYALCKYTSMWIMYLLYCMHRILYFVPRHLELVVACLE